MDLDESWMKRHGRVREFSNANPRYIAAVTLAVLAGVSYHSFGAATVGSATLPALLAGLSVNSLLMAYLGS